MLIRAQARDALKTAIVAALADTTVAVTKGFDGPEARIEQIWIGPTRGGLEHTVQAGAALPSDDEFTVDVLVLAAKPGQDQDTAEDRAQALMNKVIEAMGDSDFGDLTVTEASVAEAHVRWSVVSDADGPHTEPSDEGWRGYGLVEITTSTRSVYI